MALRPHNHGLHLEDEDEEEEEEEEEEDYDGGLGVSSNSGEEDEEAAVLEAAVEAEGEGEEEEKVMMSFTSSYHGDHRRHSSDATSTYTDELLQLRYHSSLPSLWFWFLFYLPICLWFIFPPLLFFKNHVHIFLMLSQTVITYKVLTGDL